MSRILRVVIGDDEPDMRDYFRACLTRLGHEVVAVVEDGRQLVEACRTHRPDLVITDVRMPELDGLDAARMIRREQPTAVLLVSAYPPPEQLDGAEGDTFLGYLVKPIKQIDLAAAITQTLFRFEEYEARQHQKGVPNPTPEGEG